ncbi:MAG: pyridoxamine 5'-phosphate oxidase family protein [Acidimicrobiales bacterium]|nr:pyridoxamine 5'-phosphate oxidase family protein [Acidimicrobiales bacterium]MDP6241596.1 pyridoxamine 5'-phosphate oxidase family protein [Acidimicrobiales bacterium]MDP7124542.1 pyridoxamine 5'-phosphate oxidase family protein [Acidimicrobiales bacterium]MDP7353198.1 pyridoxamine 5'-phosphate oxidase family protein [Acidimicrobiales bacterium]MDP7508564.1 pyridoxamine 5'-phosphate oxidase family protein [Acidimicrobiales bacterium]
MAGKSELRRMPDRAVDDPAERDAVLDEGIIAHVGLVAGEGAEPHPVVIPMLYARLGQQLLLHGSPASRLLRTAKGGVMVCVTVTLVDDLVLARSGLHHSMNYRSVVVFGTATEVADHDLKVEALDHLTEHVIPGRMETIRPHTAKEVQATTVLSMPLDEWSMKVRSGPPVDDDEDLGEPAWAGLIPLGVAVGTPIPDEHMPEGAEVPAHVAGWSRGTSG